MSDKIKKLSQAIRLGATFRPQCVGKVFTTGASCALGAAYEAMNPFLNPEFRIHMTTAGVMLEIAERFGHATISLELLERIMDRNDSKGWTRELIAQWLEEVHGL